MIVPIVGPVIGHNIFVPSRAFHHRQIGDQAGAVAKLPYSAKKRGVNVTDQSCLIDLDGKWQDVYQIVLRHGIHGNEGNRRLTDLSDGWRRICRENFFKQDSNLRMITILGRYKNTPLPLSADEVEVDHCQKSATAAPIGAADPGAVG